MLKQYNQTKNAGVNLLRNTGVSLLRNSGVNLKRNGGVSLDGISNITGRKIADYELATGSKIITVSETNLNNGIYFYTYKVNGSVEQSEKIVIIK